jgi:hypothetical protein
VADDRNGIVSDDGKLFDLRHLCGALLAGLGGLAFFSLLLALVVIVVLGLLKLVFGFQIVQFWHAYFVAPTAQWLKLLISHFDGDAGLAIVWFAVSLVILETLILSPNAVIFSHAFVNWQRSTTGKVNTNDWNAVQNRLSLLFGDDIEELALYERRILPANPGTEAQAAAPPARGWPSTLRVFQVLHFLLKVLYFPFSTVVTMGLGIAFFDAINRAFGQNEASFFPTGEAGTISVPDHLGFAAASDWTIIAIIAVGAIVLMAVTNKPLLTLQWPVHSLRNATIAIVCIVVVQKLMLPRPILLFSSVCIVSFAAITLLWRWIGRPVLLRVRFWVK